GVAKPAGHAGDLIGTGIDRNRTTVLALEEGIVDRAVDFRPGEVAANSDDPVARELVVAPALHTAHNSGAAVHADRTSERRNDLTNERSEGARYRISGIGEN